MTGFAEVLTLPEVSKYLKLHPMTVYKLVRRRRIPMIKIGGQWRISKEVLEQWLEDRSEKVLKP